MYRNRLTEGSFEGTEKGVKATLKAAPPAEPSATVIPAGEQTTEEEPPAPAGVRLKGDFQRATVSGLAAL